MRDDVYKIVRKPLQTEKGSVLREDNNEYLFEVDKDANKLEIKVAIESIFEVKVLRVRTLNQIGKRKRYRWRYGKRPGYKKAYVTLAEGHSIDIYEGI